MLAPNGTRSGGWLPNTDDKRFRRFADVTGEGDANVLALKGSTFDVPMLAPNGTRFGGWLLDTAGDRS